MSVIKDLDVKRMEKDIERWNTCDLIVCATLIGCICVYVAMLWSVGR